MTSDQADETKAEYAARSRKWVPRLGLLTGWVWGIVAGGGGLWLLFTRGPWPLTNGWFALASGISGCPLTAWALRRLTGITVSGWTQFTFALLFWIAGRIALKIGT
jgi:hypothetical protein